MIIHVGSKREFQTIQSALDSLAGNTEKPVTILIDPGLYREKLFINQNNLRLIGAGQEAADTVISWADSAKKPLLDGKPMRTFLSYTIYIRGEDFFAKNLSFENTAGPGGIAGQAVAVYADADRMHFKNCRFLGWQDTLCTGPLPNDPEPVMEWGNHNFHIFNEGSLVFRQYYEDCYITGDVDFIFGSARALFHNCQIESLWNKDSEGNFITAPAHPSWEPFGYTFINCRLTSLTPEGSVYLGRPWRGYGKVSFWNCWMDKSICAEGWHHWTKVREQTARFMEAGCVGPGAQAEERVSWVKIIPKSAESLPAMSDMGFEYVDNNDSD
ncbi:MAG: pectinesterase family protein [Spirochaetales bacterium]|nr:pectinesterase family protein [Spirochaetales bacterium]